jgi:hypothetical protein
VQAEDGDTFVPYPHPGLIMLEPRSRDLTLCFGEARLQDGFGPLPAIPVCEIGGDLSELDRIGRTLIYDGALPLRIESSADQNSPLPEPPREGRLIVLDLDGVLATATLLERTSPVTAASLARSLPLSGIATNTFLSGPLARLRVDGGTENDPALASVPKEAVSTILWPGYVYYGPGPTGGQGLRIAARYATEMGSSRRGRETKLVPVARLVGDWRAFGERTERLRLTGAAPLRLRLLAD